MSEAAQAREPYAEALALAETDDDVTSAAYALASMTRKGPLKELYPYTVKLGGGDRDHVRAVLMPVLRQFTEACPAYD